LEKAFYTPSSIDAVKQGLISMKKIIAGFLLLLIAVSIIFTVTPNAEAQTENVKILNYSY